MVAIQIPCSGIGGIARISSQYKRDLRYGPGMAKRPGSALIGVGSSYKKLCTVARVTMRIRGMSASE
jgi:hypothetical protein